MSPELDWFPCVGVTTVELPFFPHPDYYVWNVDRVLSEPRRRIPDVRFGDNIRRPGDTTFVVLTVPLKDYSSSSPGNSYPVSSSKAIAFQVPDI